MFMPSGVASAAGAAKNYIVTAGQQVAAIGFLRATYGALSPDDPFKENTIQRIVNLTNNNIFRFGMLASPPDTDATFRRLRLSGIFASGAGELDLLRADASYSINNGESRWDWPETLVMVSGNTYTLTLE